MIKTSCQNNLILKASLELHAKRDWNCFSVGSDSASAYLSTVRLDLCLAQISDTIIITTDVKEVFMQTRPVHREFYVKRPRYVYYRENTPWKLKRLLFGSVESK